MKNRRAPVIAPAAVPAPVQPAPIDPPASASFKPSDEHFDKLVSLSFYIFCDRKGSSIGRSHRLSLEHELGMADVQRIQSLYEKYDVEHLRHGSIWYIGVPIRFGQQVTKFQSYVKMELRPSTYNDN
jgi:hypothetical protein